MLQKSPSSIHDQGGETPLSPTAARLLLFALLAVTAILIWFARDIVEPPRRSGPSDLDTYERVVAALKVGQSYYPTLHQALLDGGYGTLSPLNWRTPTFFTFLAWFPTLGMAQVFLTIITLIAWMFGVALGVRRGGVALSAGAGLALALCLVSIIAPRAELSFELCTGTLILISVCAYGLGWRWIGLAVAALALFVRELTVIYVIVCVILAIREKRWRETGAWAVAIVTYGAFYFWHVSQAMAQIGPLDHAATNDWLQFGGLAFMLRTAGFSGVLLVTPHWVAAPVLVLGLVGLSRLPRAAVSVLLYLALFLVYGRPENEYWGAMYAPVVALGVAFSVAPLGRLIEAAVSRRPSRAAG